MMKQKLMELIDKCLDDPSFYSNGNERIRVNENHHRFYQEIYSAKWDENSANETEINFAWIELHNKIVGSYEPTLIENGTIEIVFVDYPSITIKFDPQLDTNTYEETLTVEKKQRAALPWMTPFGKRETVDVKIMVTHTVQTERYIVQSGSVSCHINDYEYSEILKKFKSNKVKLELKFNTDKIEERLKKYSKLNS